MFDEHESAELEVAADLAAVERQLARLNARRAAHRSRSADVRGRRRRPQAGPATAGLSRF